MQDLFIFNFLNFCLIFIYIFIFFGAGLCTRFYFCMFWPRSRNKLFSVLTFNIAISYYPIGSLKVWKQNNINYPPLDLFLCLQNKPLYNPKCSKCHNVICLHVYFWVVFTLTDYITIKSSTLSFCPPNRFTPRKLVNIQWRRKFKDLKTLKPTNQTNKQKTNKQTNK